MEYVVKIPAVNGDVISLVHLGTCMASAHATAYGKTAFHEQRFQSCFRRFDEFILEEAQAGWLQVCNDIGRPGTADEIINAVKKSRGLLETRRYIVEPDWVRLRKEHPPSPSGEMDLQGVDLGPTEIDLVYMHLECLHVKLHHLNEWAKVRGDTFSISHDGVVWLEGYVKNGKLESEICGCNSDMEQLPPAAEAAVKGVTTGEIDMAFGGLVSNMKLKKAMGDGATKWLLDARISKGSPGREGHQAQWNPLILAVALCERNLATKRVLSRAFLDHSFLADWREEWKEQEKNLI